MTTVEEIAALPDFQSDYEFFESTPIENDVIDLPFLETSENSAGLFAINPDYFEALDELKPEPVFIPSLYNQVFEEPIKHALWTSNAWPETKKHFPA